MKKYSFLLLFLTTSVFAQWFYSSGTAQNLENKLTFKNRVSAQTGNITPTSGVNAATGSVYQKMDGTFWLKQAGATTSWARVATSSEIPAAITSLTGEVTATGPGASAATVTNSAVIGKVLTGYTSGAGTVAATDTILQAIQKLNGNAGNYVLKAGDTMTGQLKVDGSADQAQLIVEGHSTQTSNLFEIYSNTPTYLAGFDQNGHLRMRDASASSGANPQLYFVTGSNKSGIGYNSAGVNSELFFTTNGTSRFSLGLGGAVFQPVIFGNGNGASAPAFAMATSDGDTGLAYVTTNSLCLSAGGTCRITASSTTSTVSNNLVVSGSTTLATSLTGALRASSGVVSTGSTSLTTEVSGTLPIANGGTGLTSVSSGSVLIASGSAYVNYPGVTTGDVLTWNGSAWRSATPSAGGSGFGSWSTPVAITVTTQVPSAPTKGTTSQDYITCRESGTDFVECEVGYQQTSSGAAAGSGGYIISLPSGFTIDTSKYSNASSTITSGTAASGGSAMGGYCFIVTTGAGARDGSPVAYSTTQFYVRNDSDYWSSANQHFGNAMGFRCSFRFFGTAP